MNRFFCLIALLCCFANLSHAQTWYKANDPFGGRVIEMHETDNGALLCGTTRGLYKSNDNGENWQDISGEYDYLPVSDVKSTPSGMYISLFSYFLRRSYDGGQTWETITPQSWTSLNKIVVNSSGQIFLNTNNSIWRSSDNGDSWTQLTVDANVPTLNTLELSPDGELFAGTYNKKVYRSNDNGDTWTELFTAANDIRTFGFAGNDTIYGATSFSGLYISIDNGDNWSMLNALPGTNGALDLNVNTAGDLFAAAYDGGIYKSTDGGMTWQDITSDLLDPSLNKIFVNSTGELFVGTRSAGVYQYDGASWAAKNQGISAIYIQRFVSIDSTLYACTSNGVFISEDLGQSWVQSIKGMDDPDIVALAKAPNGDLYAGGEMLYYSVDGINWIDISQGFPSSEVTATDIFIETNGRVVVATDDYGIRYTDDQGQSWTNANTGLQDVTINFIKKDGQGYFYTADGYNLYRSNDLSGSWSTINNGLADTDITGFAVGNGALFAITYSDGLFKSTDNGDNWSLAIDEDFNNVAINGNEVYGASERVVSGGVYLSTDNGANWNNIGNGLPNVQVEEVGYVQGLGLFVNVREFGLYTLNFSVVGISRPKSEEGKLSCFPNPFAATTNVKLVFEENTTITYTILTLQGEIVHHSGLLTFSKGAYDIQIGAHLDPGCYLITINGKNVFNTARLIKIN